MFCLVSAVTSERSVEQVMVHTLQMELEGTRDSVLGLERRMDDLHGDLVSVARNVDCLLQVLSSNPAFSMQPAHDTTRSPPRPLVGDATPSFYLRQSDDALDESEPRDTNSSASSTTPPRPSATSSAGSARVSFSPITNYYIPPHVPHTQSISQSQSAASNIESSGGDPADASCSQIYSDVDVHGDSSPSTCALPEENGHSLSEEEESGQEEEEEDSPCPPPSGVSEYIPLKTANLTEIPSRRPSYLFPLQKRRSKNTYLKQPRSRSRSDGNILAVTTPPTTSSDDVTQSPHTRSNSFQGDYYTLAQLEPCDRSGMCEKADVIRGTNNFVKPESRRKTSIPLLGPAGRRKSSSLSCRKTSIPENEVKSDVFSDNPAYVHTDHVLRHANAKPSTHGGSRMPYRKTASLKRNSAPESCLPLGREKRYSVPETSLPSNRDMNQMLTRSADDKLLHRYHALSPGHSASQLSNSSEATNNTDLITNSAEHPTKFQSNSMSTIPLLSSVSFDLDSRLSRSASAALTSPATSTSRDTPDDMRDYVMQDCDVINDVTSGVCLETTADSNC